jgi:gentisate 1,2-dioxygenase
LLPADFVSTGQTSPVFAYPYARSRDALEHLKRAESFDPIHGLKMRYINPATGGEAMATISAFLQLLPNGFEGRPYRATEASVYIVAEGHGHTELEGAAYVWGPNDIFVIPNWVKHRHVASSEAVLFSCSDRGIHQNLGFWREDRSPA